jgi:hypothetical protein
MLVLNAGGNSFGLSEALTFKSLPVDLLTIQVLHSTILHGDYIAFMCFVWLSEQTANLTLHKINSLVFVNETECLQRGTD